MRYREHIYFQTLRQVFWVDQRHELKERLRKFGLELAQDKTRVMPFSRYCQGETSFWVSSFAGV